MEKHRYKLKPHIKHHKAVALHYLYLRFRQKARPDTFCMRFRQKARPDTFCMRPDTFCMDTFCNGGLSAIAHPIAQTGFAFGQLADMEDYELAEVA